MNFLILHLEISEFVTEATAQRYPHLRGRPFVIAPLGADRARVYAASPAARQMGIRRGMLLREAQKIDRRLIVQPPEERFYTAVSQELLKTVAVVSPVIEPWRYGHVYVEILQRRETWEQARDTAHRLQKMVAERLSLTPAVGMGTNKMISRAASSRAARRRDILWVPAGRERAFIAPFEINYLPHVDRPARDILHNLNIWRVGELAALSRLELQELFGRVGWRIHDEAHGLDPSPVVPPEKQAALYEEWVFSPETNDHHSIHSAGYTLLNRLARRLRDQHLGARRVALTATYADQRFFSAWRRCPAGGMHEDELLQALAPLFERMLARRVALLRLGIRLLHLQPLLQLDLFAPQAPPKQARLAAAMDLIKARFGEQAVLLGKQVGVLGGRKRRNNGA